MATIPKGYIRKLFLFRFIYFTIIIIIIIIDRFCFVFFVCFLLLFLFLFCFFFHFILCPCLCISAKFCYYMEIRSLICNANQYAGFYIMTKLRCFWSFLLLYLKGKEKLVIFQWKSATTIYFAFCFFMHSPQTHRPLRARVMLKPFIRTSWVLTETHITKTSAFAKTIPFSVIVICIM